MKDTRYDTDDCIAALATPWGESALAVVRTSGQGSIEKIDSIFSGKKPLASVKGYSCLRGSLLEQEGRGEIDDIIAAVFRTPNSYTGEDSVELFLHGSLPGIERVFEALKKAGFRQANPGEFTLRAFLNGKIDLTRAEAVNEIVTAKSKQAQTLAMNRLSGAVEGRINVLKDELLHLVSQVELQLDYSEDEGEAEDLPVDLSMLDAVINGCRELIDTYKTGKVYQQGVRIVLAGRTNAGKSSLFNLFLREDRSIVSEVHGTTRDYIESWISLDGVPVLLYDTAGLRTAAHPVEWEGIRRTEKIMEHADIVLYLVDAQEGITDDDRARIGDFEQQCARPGNEYLKVWNKTDLSDNSVPEGFIPLSTKTGSGFSELQQRIKQLCIGSAADFGEGPVIDSLRQKELLQRASSSLSRVRGEAEEGAPLDMLAVDLKEAMDALGEITGEVTTADILDEIFSNFCVGK